MSPSAAARPSIRRRPTHLADCGECRARYSELSQLHGRLARRGRSRDRRRSSRPQQLRVQQQQIMRRLEHLGHSGARLQLPGAADAPAPGATRAAHRVRAGRPRPPAPGCSSASAWACFSTRGPARRRWRMTVGASTAPGGADRRDRQPGARTRRSTTMPSCPSSRWRLAARTIGSFCPSTRSRRTCESAAVARAGTRDPRSACADRRCRRDTCSRRHRSAHVVPSLIFRKGLDLKDAVAGMLAENYHSEIIERIKADRLHLPRRPPDGPPRARIRVLLRRRSRRGLRVSDAAALSRPPRLPDRRDHPQPARQREAAGHGHRLPERRPRRASIGSARTTS